MLVSSVRRAKPPTTPTDAELLDLHYKELAMPPREPPPEVPEEEEEPTEEEEEEGEPEEPAEDPAAETASVTPSTGYGMPAAPEGEAKRRRGRPRKPRPSQATGVAKDSSFTADGIVSATRWPTEASQVWEKILREVAPQKQYGPENIYALVYRYGVGSVSGQTFHANRVYLTRIDGMSIAGNETVSPGEALTEYMETVVHPSSPGAARYELNFHKRTGSTIKVGEMQFAHPQEVARQRAAAAEHTARMQASGFGAPTPMPGRGYPAPGYGQPPPYYPPPASPYSPPPPYYPPPQDPAIRGEVEAMRREVATMLGRIDEGRAREAEKRGEPPPQPIAPQIIAPAAAPESEEMRIARIVRAVLHESGVKPVGVGAPPVGVGVAAVTTQVKDGIGALRDAMSMFKELDKFRREVGMAAPDEDGEVVQAPNPIVEDPNAPAFGVKPVPFATYKGKQIMYPMPQYEVDEGGNKIRVDESFLEKSGRFVAANPEFALSFLEGASKVLGQGAFGQLLQAVAAQGGGAAKAAAEMAGRTANGAGGGGAGLGGTGTPPGYPGP